MGNIFRPQSFGWFMIAIGFNNIFRKEDLKEFLIRLAESSFEIGKIR